MCSFFSYSKVIAAKEGTQVTEQIIPIDRRHYPREGVMAQLEDITYAALRRNGIIGEVKTDQMDSSSEMTVAIH